MTNQDKADWLRARMEVCETAYPHNYEGAIQYLAYVSNLVEEYGFEVKRMAARNHMVQLFLALPDASRGFILTYAAEDGQTHIEELDAEQTADYALRINKQQWKCFDEPVKN